MDQSQSPSGMATYILTVKMHNCNPFLALIVVYCFFESPFVVTMGTNTLPGVHIIQYAHYYKQLL